MNNGSIEQWAQWRAALKRIAMLMAEANLIWQLTPPPGQELLSATATTLARALGS